ncbi:MAG: CsbD family protein [Gaiellales bacterium]|jgi:uncharacterized protein YjbJ (UPF0337 family)
MSNWDEVKGTTKEKIGDATDDKELEREGQVDQATGKAKEGIDKAADAIKDKLD